MHTLLYKVLRNNNNNNDVDVALLRKRQGTFTVRRHSSIHILDKRNASRCVTQI